MLGTSGSTAPPLNSDRQTSSLATLALLMTLSRAFFSTPHRPMIEPERAKPMSENLPRLFRPNRAMIVAVAPLLTNDDYLGMTERDFTGAVMKASGGAVSPKRVSDLYWQLITEANVKPPK